MVSSTVDLPRSCSVKQNGSQGAPSFVLFEVDVLDVLCLINLSPALEPMLHGYVTGRP